LECGGLTPLSLPHSPSLTPVGAEPNPSRRRAARSFAAQSPQDPGKIRFKIDSYKDTPNPENCPSLTSNMRPVVKPNINELSYTIS
jgi:hypothetical protein